MSRTLSEFAIFLVLVVTLVVIPSLLAGCASTAGTAARYMTDQYCQHSAVDRAAVRWAVNQAVTPNRVEITCSGAPK